MTKATRSRSAALSVPDEGTLGLSDQLLGWRDRALESSKFQRLSADFPLSRGVARREAQELFDLCAGFVYSQILFACVSLGVFEYLRDRPRSLNDLSRRLSLPPAATERLMRGGVALRLLSRRKNGQYGLGMLGAALNGNPGVAAMIRHHAMLYRDLADPIALLRGERSGDLSRYWAYASAENASEIDDGKVADYSALMTASQQMIAADILDACSLSGFKKLLDVGGGEGAFITAASARNPTLLFQLYDLPAVADRARQGFARTGLAGRTEVFGGDFTENALPVGADIVTLVRILHDHDDEIVVRLLEKVRGILPERGALLIAEPFAQTRGAERIGDAYFGFYLLAMGQGRPRSFNELSGMLREAGFSSIRRLKTRRPMLTGALLATP